MKIHRLGFLIISLFFIILFIINGLTYYFFKESVFINLTIQIISITIFVVVVQFFRNPQRRVIENPYVILAPADGKVVTIEKVFENEFLNEERILISIFMSIWDVHVNRFPVGGEVSYFKHHKGKYFIARNPKSSEENEQTSIAVKMHDQQHIMFKQIAGYLARRIITKLEVGDKAKQGEEFGFIKFGSRMDIFLPLDAKIKVKLNDQVYGGISILADILPKQNKD